MNDISEELGLLKSWADQIMASIIAYLPNMMSALAVLLIGWLLAKILRGVSRRVFGWLNRGLNRVFRRDELASSQMSERAGALLSGIVFWVVIFITAAIAARIAGLVILSAWLDQIVIYLPSLVVGAAIIVVGYILSVLAGEQVASAARLARSSQSHVLGRLAQIIIFMAALIIGLDQFGINVTFLVALFAVALGAIFVGFSLAFGLGARDLVSDMISARDLGRKIKPGLNIRIGDQEGEVLEITATRLVLSTDCGRVLISGRAAALGTIVILASEAAKGGDHV